MLEPEYYVNGGSGQSKFVAQSHKDNSGIQASKTFAETVRGHQVQGRGRNQPLLLSIHDKGKSHLGEDKVVKQNPEGEQMVLNKNPAGKPCPTALGRGGDVGSRCINVNFNLGEINPVGNKKRFPLRFSSNSNESAYGKERDLRKSYWTGKGLTVEVNGEGRRHAAWDCNKGGFNSFKWVKGGQKEQVVGLRHSL